MQRDKITFFPATPRIFHSVCAPGFYFLHFLTSAGRQRNINFPCCRFQRARRGAALFDQWLDFIYPGQLFMRWRRQRRWRCEMTTSRRKTLSTATHTHNSPSVFSQLVKNIKFAPLPSDRVCIPTGRERSFCNWRRAAADVGPNYFHPLISGESV